MIVTHLNLTDFRNYESLDVEIVPGPNVFVGSNGQGKTNLVESLGYLSTLASHRVSQDHALIRFGQDAAVVRAQLRNGERSLLVELQINRSGANRAQVNRSVIKTRELTRYFSSVLFAPEDLALVRGEPSGRRRFLDELLVERNPRLAAVLADYDRVLRQRNTLLKSARSVGSRGDIANTLEIWDERLVAFGSEIVTARTQLIADLLPEVRSAYRSIAGEDHEVSLIQQLSINGDQSSDGFPLLMRATEGQDDGTPFTIAKVTENFRNSLTRVRRAELERGLSLVGPHRDDLFIGLNNLPARGYASHGESWSLALSLKLASAAIVRRDSLSGDPVLILDDVFAELDQTRRQRLGNAVGHFEQVLITAAVLDDVPENLAGNIIRIQAGTVIAGAF
ncbi:MAG: DNA replication/repair protein RecF [Microbacteriaceae bacterium]